jgi:hypothetical protein
MRSSVPDPVLHPEDTHPEEFLSLSREEQNQKIDELFENKRLFPWMHALVASVPFSYSNPLPTFLYTSYLALHRFSQRLDYVTFRPLVRSWVRIFHRVSPELREQEEPLDPSLIFEEFHLRPEDLYDPQGRYPALSRIALEYCGPLAWQYNLALFKSLHRAGTLLKEPDIRKIISRVLYVILESRRNTKPYALWQEVFRRTTFQSSDLYFHENRLRYAILEKNLDQAYRLMVVLCKGGRNSLTEIICALLKATYDIDFVDPEHTLRLFLGLGLLLEWAPLFSPDWFYRGIASAIWDIAHEPKRPHGRIFYDEISVIKSREVIPDFRKAMQRGDFAGSWGYAEYAFVYGYDGLKILDEIVKLTPSAFRGGPELLWVWSYLHLYESLLLLLPEDMRIYVLAFIVRVLSRSPQDPSALDPFPDELEQ